MTQQISTFEEFGYFMADIIEKKNIAQDEDQVILCCGYEGTGKSTFTIALYCLICYIRKIKPRKELIFYEWREYLMRNLYAMIDSLNKSPKHLVEEVMGELEMTTEMLDIPDGMYLPKAGDVMCYDEAGTQAFNRDAMSKGNINQAKLLIANRFLNLVHIWNVPHPGSVDIYTREQRTKIMILVDAIYTKDLKQKIRSVYVWDKEGYTQILEMSGWKSLVKKPRYLASKVKPAMVMKLPPDLPEWIPKDIMEYYNTKKKVFNIRQVLTMKSDIDGDDKEKPEKEVKDNVGDLVQEGEKMKDWVKRTNLSPNYYNNYGGSRKWKKKM